LFEIIESFCFNSVELLLSSVVAVIAFSLLEQDIIIKIKTDIKKKFVISFIGLFVAASYRWL
jgi:hypothetical protein